MPKTFHIKVTYADGDLERAISFIDERPGVVEATIQEYFSSPEININLAEITDEAKRNFHSSGLTAVLINLITAK